VPALLAACAGAPPPPPPPPGASTSPAAVILPPPLAARWVESGGGTLVGPSLPGGTLVLLGGRRALVHADGSLETETVPAPEPLAELVEVPSAAGPRLAGRGLHDVYRFDDPLGAPRVLARSRDPLARLGAGPGVVAVWTGGSELPRFLDVETGREQKLAGLPDLPLRALSFVDARRGAGIFEAVGLGVTGDGGATWRLAGEAASGDALRVGGLRRRGGAVHAFAYADGPDGAVDLDAGRVGALEIRRPPATEAPILRWIRTTGRDPLEAIAAGGLDLPAGGALVASHGLLARVDPGSGAIVGLQAITRSQWASPCGAGRSGQTAWIACAVSEDADKSLFDPFGVMRVPLGEPGLAAERPALVRNGEAELRVSPSGGVMLAAPCSNEEIGSACVRQPDGKWKTFAADLTERGAGPLADGRVAFLRGMFDGDEPAPEPGDDEGGVTRRLHVAIAGPDGKEHHLAPIGFTPSRGYVRVQSAIEEDRDHTLRFVIEDGEGPFAVIVTGAGGGPDSAEAHKIPDTVAARMHAGRGVAVGEGRVLASLDGGATWSEIPTSPAVLDAASAVAASYEDPGQLAVSDLGAKVGTMLRIGWAPEGVAPLDPAPREPHDSRAPAPDGGTSAPLLASPPPAPQGPEQVLTCASQGPAPGMPPLNGSAEVKQLLAPPVRSPAGAGGARHETTAWSSGRAGMLDTLALLDEEGPEARGSAPSRWTLRWHDPTELGGKVRSATLPAPAGATFGTSLRFAAASAGRALFVVRSGGKIRLVRVRPGSAAEIVEVAGDLVPLGDVVFGEARSEAIAWLREAQVIAWLPGEHPRVIARIGTHAARFLGAPTPSGVPLLLGSSDWLLQRTLPIPPLVPSAGADPPPAPPSLEGWARLPPLPRRLDALRVCAPRAAGARFSLSRLQLRAEVDGVGEGGSQAIYDVRIDGGDACVAGVTATLSPDRSSAKPAAPPAGKTPPAAAGPAAFVRVDLAGKRAEGGARGLPAAVRRLSCALSPKP
jgi:hypothetical protein